MKVRVLGGSGGLVPGRLLTSFLIDDNIAVDAGSLTEALTLEEQERIDHILITHGHLDHSGSLPFFVDNIFGTRDEPFLVHSIPEAVKSVREHLFNNDIWPDFSMLPDLKRASMRFSEIETETPLRIGHLVVTAVRVNHTIPCVGYVIDDGSSSVLFSGDTAPTERLWEVAARAPNLRAAFVETSFPNRMQKIADVSGHLTPQTLKDELPKLNREVPIFIYHVKPRFYEEVVAEIRALGVKDVHMVEQGLTYEFS
jgi:ribonuclease BN (tRNA processing enzyme)